MIGPLRPLVRLDECSNVECLTRQRAQTECTKHRALSPCVKYNNWESKFTIPDKWPLTHTSTTKRTSRQISRLKEGQNGRHMDAIWETNSDNHTKSPSTTAKLQANRDKRKTKAERGENSHQTCETKGKGRQTETKRKTTQTRPPKLGDNWRETKGGHSHPCCRGGGGGINRARKTRATQA